MQTAGYIVAICNDFPCMLQTDDWLVHLCRRHLILLRNRLSVAQLDLFVGRDEDSPHD